MSAQTTAKPKLKTFSTTVSEFIDIDVDIEPDELHEAGWHHESECSSVHVPIAVSTLGEAVASLHRQAHPGEQRSVRLCHEEPCRSLSLEQLDEVDG